MEKRVHIQPASILIGLLGALVLVALVGATSAETITATTRPEATSTLEMRGRTTRGGHRQCRRPKRWQ